ncbi:MAG: nucleotidyl transferase AbiEii/AbiGii toxin family protein, partial [Candidatus Taylorbacteria bacterium]|nr:nucleotidyl transferase AbiEii/AbiGii toxin family protein [Candidatus Taylorbacteria bacterium]
DNTIYGKLLGAKVSFIAYPFFIPKQKFLRYGAVSIIQPLDVAVMKIVAISQRGKKRDFFDLYWCAHHLESLEKLIERLGEQYPSVAHDYHHIIKSLAYFEDAESDPPLVLHFDASWEQVKKFFIEEVERIAFKFV